MAPPEILMGLHLNCERFADLIKFQSVTVRLAFVSPTGFGIMAD
jgi:hypothetical protein